MSPETAIRLGSFLGMLMIMGMAETVWPRRAPTAPKGKRWLSNLSVLALSTLLIRLLVPFIPTGVALYAAENGIGLLNAVALPHWAAIVISVLLLDMVIYWQHVAFHRIPVLWRIHRMHHADTDIDASTGIRFHPIEFILSMGLKLSVILVLGPPVIGVIAFEVLLNGCAVFNHANVRLPITLDKWLRLIVVTPDQHRVHHSTSPKEFNMNYGFNLPWWDRLFHTYKPQPDLGHQGMKIGLNIFRDPVFLGLGRMLTIPFR
ncbi:sterol desaturase family protein [Pseudodesulfovibrio portus]|uniref:Fatty acid hydroxylase domain-containing protein n=1 Tax=Pseudodesulfovibrio portus TaxID=231439 RepID=A0ABM8ANC6_9BACT|nr:sterol desaturase family protein [Pseudodesulfovibrio portus]BDQ32888.1 hypothetical protein JCM14722_04300 [Pseudodesulfovibrio portus]